MLLSGLAVVLPDELMQIFTDEVLDRLVLQLGASNAIVIVADEPRIHREASLDLRLLRSDKQRRQSSKAVPTNGEFGQVQFDAARELKCSE